MIAIAIGAVVLGFGAVTGGSAPVHAVEEEPYTQNELTCETSYTNSWCRDYGGGFVWCYEYVVQICTTDSGGSVYTETSSSYDPYKDENGDDICGLYVYCP